MSDEEKTRLSPTARQVLGKTRVPHKFCPYCGTRNEANAEVCESCGKNIAWMKVPEQKPRELPKQRTAFSKKTLVIILLILALIVITVLVLLLTVGKSKGATAGFPYAVLCMTGLVLPSLRGWGRPPGRLTKGVVHVEVPIMRQRGPSR
jgi:predicted nucleic acid-binding Zn ribbon protein